MAGKKFAAEFALRRNVSAQDKILIQDSDDDVVKYAYPPQIASLSGYAYAQSVADLPLLPSNKSIGYIVGQMLYIYVGMGGDTKDGLYQSVGFFVGPQGVQGEKGEKGERGEQGVQGPKGDNGGLSLQELDKYLGTKQYVTGDTLADMLAGYVSNTSLMRDYVTIAKAQDVTGVKNFTAGVQFGGLPMYKSKDDTVYLDANLVVRGAVTMYGMNTTTSPSIFSALPIDGTTIGRNERGELYVIGGTSGGGSGTGGGISIADVESYLTTNGYITSASSITGNAGSASKLQNAVSLWGRSFDGSADLTGSLTVTTGEGYRINYNGYDLRFIVSGNSANRGIWDNTLNSWMMYRDDTENVRFPKGNVGIGDASPSYKLHVRGTMGVTDVATFASNINLTSTPTEAFAGAQMLFAGGNARIGVTTSGFMGLYASNFTFRPSSTTTASSSAFTIDANANISTTGKLTLPIGSSNYTNASLWFGDSVRIGANSSNSLGIFAGYAIRLNPDSATSASTTKGLWLLSSGYNGVNNTSPTEALDVVGNIKTSGKVNVNGGVIEYDSARKAWQLIGDLVVTGGVSMFSNINGFTPSTITDAVMIDGSTIKRNAGGLLYAVLPNSINGDLAISGRLTTQNNIVAEHSSNPFVALKRDGTTWYCQVTSSGIKLGQGSAKSINVDTSGNLTAPGSITPNTSSDERLKRNLRKFNASEVLMSLGGVWKYEYIDSEVKSNHIYEGTHYGLIYQNVVGTPLASMCNIREDGYGTLNYVHPKFISLIAGATMENTTEIEKLKEENKALRKEVELLKQRVA